MRLAISNIAWDVEHDGAVASLLRSHQIDAIDIAPGKYFPDPKNAKSADIDGVRHWWADRGIAITGMQALLFGTTGLNLFGTAPVQSAMIEHLSAVCRIGAGLGASRLVFGSPRNRDRSGMDDSDVTAMAVAFFCRLGDVAESYGVQICLEPNPTCYGANFMTNCLETAEIVEQANHPAIRMQLDTGALTINGEDPADVVNKWARLIGHVHASEPDLVPLGDGSTEHGAVAVALLRHLPRHVVSIEMLAANREPQVAAIERALGVAIHYYRDEANTLTTLL